MAVADVVATGPHGAIVEATLAEAVATIMVRGDLDGAAIPDVARAIADSLSRVRVNVVLDLGDIAFIDADGLEFIVRVRQRLAKGGGTLTVYRPTAEIQRLLAVCGIVDLAVSSRLASASRADIESRRYVA